MPTTAPFTNFCAATVATDGATAAATPASSAHASVPTSTGLRPTLSESPPMMGERPISVAADVVASAVSSRTPST